MSSGGRPFNLIVRRHMILDITIWSLLAVIGALGFWVVFDNVANSSRKKTSATAFGCLFFVLGALGGCTTGFYWAKSQVQTDRSGNVLTDDARGVTVFGKALIGGFAGGAVVSIAALIWRFRRRKGQQLSNDQEK